MYGFINIHRRGLAFLTVFFVMAAIFLPIQQSEAAGTDLPVIEYLKITPTLGVVNSTVFDFDLVLTRTVDEVYIEYLDNEEQWSIRESFYGSGRHYTYYRSFMQKAVRKFRIYALLSSESVLIKSGSFTINASGGESGRIEEGKKPVQDVNPGEGRQAGQDYGGQQGNGVQQDNGGKQNNGVQQDSDSQQDSGVQQEAQTIFTLTSVQPYYVNTAQQKQEFVVTGTGIGRDASGFSGKLACGDFEYDLNGIQVKNDNILSFSVDNLEGFKDGKYTLTVYQPDGTKAGLKDCISMSREINTCKIELGRLVIEADKIIDHSDLKDVKLAYGNVKINGQIYCSSDLEIHMGNKMVRGTGQLGINSKNFGPGDSEAAYVITENGGFQIDASTGIIKLDSPGNPIYLAGLACGVDVFEITKEDGLLINLNLFNFADLVKKLVEDRDSLKYLAGIKKFELRAQIKDRVFRLCSNVDGTLKGDFKQLESIKFFNAFRFFDIKYKYDGIRDLFTGEAAVQIGDDGVRFLPMIPELKLSGGISIGNGRLGLNKIGGKISGCNLPIDTTGFNFKGLEISLEDIYVGPCILKILADLTAGPQIAVGGNDYSLFTIKEAGLEFNLTDYEVSLVGKARLLDMEPDLAAFRASFGYKKGAELEGQLKLACFNGKLLIWLKSPEDFGGSMNGSFLAPKETPIIGGREIADAELHVENNRQQGPWAFAQLQVWKEFNLTASYYFTQKKLDIGGNLIKKSYILGELSPRLGQRHVAFAGSKPVFGFAVNMPLFGSDYFAYYESKGIKIPEGMEEAAIRITWDSGDYRFNMVTPDGRIITPDGAAYSSVKWFYLDNSENHEASYLLDHPLPGEYKIICQGRDPGAVRVELLGVNKEPVFRFNTIKPAGRNVDIGWNIRDDDSMEEISLYYDTDNSEYDGKPIVEETAGRTGDSFHTWDTSGIPEDDYYIYARIYDGVNAPAYVYSDTPVHITGKGRLPAPLNLNAVSRNGDIELAWDDVKVESVDGYDISVYDEDGKFVDDYTALTSSYAIRNLNTGKIYRMEVSCFDKDKNISSAKAAVTVFHHEPEYNPIELDWNFEDTVKTPEILLKGVNPSGAAVNVFINEKKMFAFKDKTFNLPVRLSEGINRIRLTAVSRTGDESIVEKVVILDSTAPGLTITSFFDGLKTLEDTYVITGRTDADSMMLNGEEVDIIDGNFKESIALDYGDNVVWVDAADKQGNTTSFSGRITRLGLDELCKRRENEVPGHWADEYITNLKNKNIVFDRELNGFKPNKPVTRAEFAAFTARLLKIEDDGGSHPFKDVDYTHPLEQYILKAYNANLIVGYQGIFNPEGFVTRQDICVIFRKAVIYTSTEGKYGKLLFRDRNKISPYAFDAVKLIYGMGIMKGKQGNIFDPGAYTTRAEAAVILTRLAEAAGID